MASLIDGQKSSSPAKMSPDLDHDLLVDISEVPMSLDRSSSWHNVTSWEPMSPNSSRASLSIDGVLSPPPQFTKQDSLQMSGTEAKDALSNVATKTSSEDDDQEPTDGWSLKSPRTPTYPSPSQRPVPASSTVEFATGREEFAPQLTSDSRAAGDPIDEQLEVVYGQPTSEYGVWESWGDGRDLVDDAGPPVEEVEHSNVLHELHRIAKTSTPRSHGTVDHALFNRGAADVGLRVEQHDHSHAPEDSRTKVPEPTAQAEHVTVTIGTAEAAMAKTRSQDDSEADRPLSPVVDRGTQTHEPARSSGTELVNRPTSTLATIGAQEALADLKEKAETFQDAYTDFIAALSEDLARMELDPLVSAAHLQSSSELPSTDCPQCKVLRTQLWTAMNSQGPPPTVHAATDNTVNDERVRGFLQERRIWKKIIKQLSVKHLAVEQELEAVRQQASEQPLEQGFMVVLFEADAETFEPTLVSRGYEGGILVAKQLRENALKHVRSGDDGGDAHVSVLLNIYVDLPRACRELGQQGLKGIEGIFRDFLDGFQEHAALNSVCDVGGARRALEKIRTLTEMYAKAKSCRAVVLIGTSPSTQLATLVDAKCHVISNWRGFGLLPPLPSAAASSISPITSPVERLSSGSQNSTQPKVLVEMGAGEKGVHTAGSAGRAPATPPRKSGSASSKEGIKPSEAERPALTAKMLEQKQAVKKSLIERMTPAPWDKHKATKPSPHQPSSNSDASTAVLGTGSLLDQFYANRQTTASGSTSVIDDNSEAGSQGTLGTKTYRTAAPTGPAAALLVPYNPDIEGSVLGSPPESDEETPSAPVPHSGRKFIQRPIVVEGVPQASSDTGGVSRPRSPFQLAVQQSFLESGKGNNAAKSKGIVGAGNPQEKLIHGFRQHKGAGAVSEKGKPYHR